MALFSGGDGDGHSAISAAANLSGADLPGLYGGGIGDGHDALAANASLSGANLAVLLGGGAGDGHSSLAFSTNLSGDKLSALFRGGDGDGHDALLVNATLSGANVAALFGGGAGDGYSGLTVAASLSSANLAALFGGGVGDGHASLRFDAGTALPLTLLTFEANVEGDFNILRWTTADEVGTDYFIIERAEDATTFNALGEVAALGGSLAQAYAYTDDQPLPGTSYYRLHIIDVDGDEEYSPLVQLTRGAAHSKVGFRMFPNPSLGTSLTILPSGLTEDSAYEVRISDVNGREVFSQTLLANEAPASLNLPKRLAPGAYSVRVRQDGESSVKILVVSGAN